ncbi:MAG: primosomal protein N', partial [Desulfovibrio sp.]|nr:primosomal protein N' [Desulfovibrio sp.]
MFLTIALLAPPYSLLTYKALSEFPAYFWQVGLRCVVPLRQKLLPGLVVETSQESKLPPKITIKEIIWPLEERPLVPSDLLLLFCEMSKRLGESLGHILAGCLPPPLRSTSVTLHLLDKNCSDLTLDDLRKADSNLRQSLASELLAGRAKLLPSKRDISEVELYDLACDPPWPVRPRATQQINVLEFLYNNGAKSRSLLKAALGPTALPALDALCQAGHVQRLLEQQGDETTELAAQEHLLPPVERPFTLNAEQNSTVEILKKALGEQKQASYLLYGVTGSGKTAV